MSCHVMSCHVMSCHVMSCHVMSCQTRFWSPKRQKNDKEQGQNEKEKQKQKEKERRKKRKPVIPGMGTPGTPGTPRTPGRKTTSGTPGPHARKSTPELYRILLRPSELLLSKPRPVETRLRHCMRSGSADDIISCHIIIYYIILCFYESQL